MKSFSCGDVVPGCTKSMQAPTADELWVQIREHANSDHGIPEMPADLVGEVSQHIVDV